MEKRNQEINLGKREFCNIIFFDVFFLEKRSQGFRYSNVQYSVKTISYILFSAETQFESTKQM